MKRIFTIVAALLMTASVWAQAPNSMSYQAVIRDANNALVTSQAVGVQISILQGSVTGTAVYVETQTPTSNTNGLISLEIGTGTTTDDFSTIDWANGPFFIQTETDPAGGTNYTITGTSQLLSVPYALHAAVADSVVGGVGMQLDSTDIAALGFITEDTDTQLDSTDIATLGFITEDTDTQLDSTDIAALGFITEDTDTQLDSTGIAALGFSATDNVNDADADATNEIQTLTVSMTGDTLTINGGNSVLVPGISLLNFPPPPAIGDTINGGIVFWIDPMDNTKGLVAALVDQSTGAEWGCFGTGIAGADGTAVGTGAQNTIDIEAGCATTGTAADICANLSLNGFNDWFLPSEDELNLMYQNIGQGNALGLGNVGGFTNSVYWSSTEVDVNFARGQFFLDGPQFNLTKIGSSSVRAVRAF